MLHHDHSYCWNDSVMLLAFWDDETPNGKNILKEIENLKCRIDEEIGENYAISVKGQAFPNDSSIDSDTSNQHCVILKTSSYAMANCFAVEKAAKGRKANWYIDSWLEKILSAPLPKSFLVEMLPTHEEREVFPFNKGVSPINT